MAIFILYMYQPTQPILKQAIHLQNKTIMQCECCLLGLGYSRHAQKVAGAICLVQCFVHNVRAVAESMDGPLVCMPNPYIPQLVFKCI
ncbi:hypothetical protein FKM82_011785 [Ascaphus truei]